MRRFNPVIILSNIKNVGQIVAFEDIFDKIGKSVIKKINKKDLKI